MKLYDAWLFKSEEWQRRPLGLHPDAESALVEAKENHPDVVSVELAGESDEYGENAERFGPWDDDDA